MIRIEWGTEEGQVPLAVVEITGTFDLASLTTVLRELETVKKAMEPAEYLLVSGSYGKDHLLRTSDYQQNKAIPSLCGLRPAEGDWRKHWMIEPVLSDPTGSYRLCARCESIWDDSQMVRSGEGEIVTKGAVKQALLDAVWKREIDQVTTREVAKKYACSLPIARSLLMSIVRGTSGDKRFILHEDGVLVEDGSTFTYSPMDVNESGTSTPNGVHHYVWFCS